MDNEKTGAFIKELRKEKSMTQRELAELLHITDRAVSKWERGLCAPDIALLEPLSEALGVSIPELMEGARAGDKSHIEELDAGAKHVIDYSKSEIAHKVSLIKKKSLLSVVACLATASIVLGLVLLRGGYLFIVDRCPSPDRKTNVTVYNKTLSAGDGFSLEDATSLIMEHEDGVKAFITYGNCTYGGIWWAPDSKKYVLSLKGYADGSDYLSLSWLEKSSSSNLSAYLSFGVEETELRKYGYVNKDGWPKIEYQFLQWGLDSESMLIYYSFDDKNAINHNGYFWYNCETGDVSAVLELDI